MGLTLAAGRREIERALDCLDVQNLDPEAFRRARALCARQYLREEPSLANLQPAVAAKLRAQHEEALEIAARLEESLAAGQAADVVYLARRFVAIVQHNIIEEERDVFPLAEDA